MHVISRTFLGPNTSITYPHCNGFTPDGGQLLYCRGTGPDGAPPRLFSRTLSTGETHELPSIPEAEEAQLPFESAMNFDVARDVPLVATIIRKHLWVIDLRSESGWRKVYTPPIDARLQDLVSLAPNGETCVVGVDTANAHSAVEVNLTAGGSRILFTKRWHANHFHYSPYDSEWVGFSHEGPTLNIPDRCWCWNGSEAPEGKTIFDQHGSSENKQLPLAVGHERWAFHDLSAYAVAYAVSPAPKRGLWEIYADGRDARLLWETNTAWHCNMDRSGRFAVIDTTAKWDAQPEAGEAFVIGVEKHLQADRERSINRSDVVLLDLKRRKWTVLAEAYRQKHPFHPHPALSSEAKWAAYNDADPAHRGAWLLEIEVDRS